MEPRNSTRKSRPPADAPDHLDLELPDWSGMDDSPTRITPEAAFRLCEQYPAMLTSEGARKRREDTDEKVPFVL